MSPQNSLISPPSSVPVRGTLLCSSYSWNKFGFVISSLQSLCYLNQDLKGSTNQNAPILYTCNSRNCFKYIYILILYYTYYINIFSCIELTINSRVNSGLKSSVADPRGRSLRMPLPLVPILSFRRHTICFLKHGGSCATSPNEILDPPLVMQSQL